MTEAADEWRRRLAAQPTRFLHHEYPSLLREAVTILAGRLGVAPDTLAFVGNASEGVSAVLRSRRFEPDDEILLLDQAYGAVRNAARVVAGRSGAHLREVAIPFPGTDAPTLVARVAAALTGRTRLAILDHVTSPGGLVLPIAAMVRICQARGVPVLVDGAHAPGQLAGLDLGAIGAEWYAGNLHKWWFAPTGSAFLHARADAQRGLLPLSISHGVGQGFAAAFDWTGTRDPAPFLAVPDALRFAEAQGGAALCRRNGALAREGAQHLAARLRTEAAPPCLEGGAMSLARLPPDAGPPTTDTALAFRRRLIERRLDAPVVALGGALWLRTSAQLYNALEDWDRAAETVLAAIDVGR